MRIAQTNSKLHIHIIYHNDVQKNFHNAQSQYPVIFIFLVYMVDELALIGRIYITKKSGYKKTTTLQ